MKAILAFLFLAICLVVMPPGYATASDHSPGSCFVQQLDLPAVSVQVTDNYAVTYVMQAHFVVQMEATQPPGAVTDELIVMKLPVVNTFYVDRICQQTYALNQRPPNLQRFATKQPDQIRSIEIRADSQI